MPMLVTTFSTKPTCWRLRRPKWRRVKGGGRGGGKRTENEVTLLLSNCGLYFLKLSSSSAVLAWLPNLLRVSEEVKSPSETEGEEEKTRKYSASSERKVRSSGTNRPRQPKWQRMRVACAKGKVPGHPSRHMAAYAPC